MNSVAETFRESSIEDISRNPHKYGAPSFDEFKRDRLKYLGRRDDTFDAIDKGSQALRRVAKKHKFEIEGRRADTLEEVEKIAHNELGIDINALDYRPELIPLGGGKCDILIKFVSKYDRARRANW